MQNATKLSKAIKPCPAQLFDAGVWDTRRAHAVLASLGESESKRTTERRLTDWGLCPAPLVASKLCDETGRPANGLVLTSVQEDARKQRKRVLFVQPHNAPNGTPLLHANDARGARYWVALPDNTEPQDLWKALALLRQHLRNDLLTLTSGQWVCHWRQAPALTGVDLAPQVFHPQRPKLDLAHASRHANSPKLSPHLERLEAESIHILREAVAESENPVMLYSIGKDSGVMLHLARKAFYPATPPFPLLHIDTRWKFQTMIAFRDQMAAACGMDLRVHTNPEAITRDINPFDHGSALHTEITKTEGLKQALDLYGFDMVLGGARRDEEKSRAKERVFSFRSSSHRWDPKGQRPELWSLYNTRKRQGESFRVFPLSNWTEIDIWHYILVEQIPVVPLYFAQLRPVVVRPDMIMMVDDERCRLRPGERIELRQVRFRTLGCYPLTGAIESSAATVEDILSELMGARTSERQGRKIDTDSASNMEKKKQEGYF